jgi:hypothetical protein
MGRFFMWKILRPREIEWFNGGNYDGKRFFLAEVVELKTHGSLGLLEDT